MKLSKELEEIINVYQELEEKEKSINEIEGSLKELLKYPSNTDTYKKELEYLVQLIIENKSLTFAIDKAIKKEMWEQKSEIKENLENLETRIIRRKS